MPIYNTAERVRVSLNKDGETPSLDDVSDLLAGKFEPLDQILLNENASREMLHSKKKNDQIMIETAAIGESFSGKNIVVDSSALVDSNLILNVTKKISSLDAKFSRVKKPDSIKARLTDNQELFFSEITDMMHQLKTWTEKLDSIEEIVLEDSDKDLLVRHHATILESVTLDREIEELTKDLNTLMEALK